MTDVTTQNGPPASSAEKSKSFFDIWLPAYFALLGISVDICGRIVTRILAKSPIPSSGVAATTPVDIVLSVLAFIFESLPNILIWGGGGIILSLIVRHCRSVYDEKVLVDLRKQHSDAKLEIEVTLEGIQTALTQRSDDVLKECREIFDGALAECRTTMMAELLDGIDLKHREVLSDTWGIVIPSRQEVVVLKDDRYPKLFKNFLAAEHKWFQDGFKGLKDEGKWPLTTADNYEFITTYLPLSNDTMILDQDIRRWYEVVEEGRPQTSTTFNYSKQILSVILGTASDKNRTSPKRIRRVFPIAKEAGCFTQADQEILAKGEFDREWKGLSNSTKVLLLLWAFEEHLSNRIKRNGLKSFECETCYKYFPDPSNNLYSQVKRCEDFVMLDGEVCCIEHTDLSKQAMPLFSTFNTQSQLLVERKFWDPLERNRENAEISFRKSTFDFLWEHEGLRTCRKVFSEEPLLREAGGLKIFENFCSSGEAKQLMHSLS